MKRTMNRRYVIAGGLFSAASAPLLVPSASARSEQASVEWGQRLLAGGDHYVFGLGACRATARVSIPASVEHESVSFSDELIERLLIASWIASRENSEGVVDPRSLVELEEYRMRGAVEFISDVESETMGILKESDLYWVRTSPWWLVGLGVASSIAIYPFLQGFFNELGVGVARKLEKWWNSWS